MIDISRHPDQSPEDRVWSNEILRTENIGDRCLRKWIKARAFPPPDGNLRGRNFWKRSTYQRWQVDVFDGKYRRESNLAKLAARSLV